MKTTFNKLRDLTEMLGLFFLFLKGDNSMRIKTEIGKIGRTIWKWMPTGLSAAAVVGVGVTVYLTVKATPKVTDILKDTTWDDEHADENKEKIIEVVKTAAPAAAAAVTTVGCIAISTYMNNRRISDLGNMYNALNNEYMRYQAAAVGLFGGEAHQAIQAKMAEKEKPVEIIKDPTKIKCTFHDSITRQDFEATIDEVLEAEAYINHQLVNDRWVSLTDYCAAFGIGKMILTDHGPVTEIQDLCWDSACLCDWNGAMELDFWNEKHTEPDGSVWFTIHTSMNPTVGGDLDFDTVSIMQGIYNGDRSA